MWEEICKLKYRTALTGKVVAIGKNTMKSGKPNLYFVVSWNIKTEVMNGLKHSKTVLFDYPRITRRSIF